jgi:hypothetical protein
MTERLRQLIEQAPSRRLTDDEIDRQSIGLAYGNLQIEEPEVTRRDVELAAARVEAERRGLGRV